MRVKRGVSAHARHKKMYALTKGFRGKRRNTFKLAKNAAMKAGTNAYTGRRLKKRDFHQLWVLRINNACREQGLRYSRFIYGLELAGIKIDRKMLSELSTNHAAVFKDVVEAVKAVLPPEGQAPNLEEIRKRFGKATPKKMPESPYMEEKAKPSKAKAKEE